MSKNNTASFLLVSSTIVFRSLGVVAVSTTLENVAKYILKDYFYSSQPSRTSIFFIVPCDLGFIVFFTLVVCIALKYYKILLVSNISA